MNEIARLVLVNQNTHSVACSANGTSTASTVPSSITRHSTLACWRWSDPGLSRVPQQLPDAVQWSGQVRPQGQFYRKRLIVALAVRRGIPMRTHSPRTCTFAADSKQFAMPLDVSANVSVPIPKDPLAAAQNDSPDRIALESPPLDDAGCGMCVNDGEDLSSDGPAGEQFGCRPPGRLFETNVGHSRVAIVFPPAVWPGQSPRPVRADRAKSSPFRYRRCLRAVLGVLPEECAADHPSVRRSRRSGSRGSPAS